MRKIKSHTLQKLEYFRKYLNAYLNATQKLPKKYYIDAFAGSGECIISENLRKVYGSAIIALTAPKAFNGYILIEKDKKIFNELKNATQRLEIDKNRLGVTKLLNEDCNERLPKICNGFSAHVGCLIFLDPEGPELFWETIVSLSKIRKADLLILYPYDMSLVRLTKNYKTKLDKFYGTEQWLDIYANRKNAGDAREKLLNFYINNLKKLGFRFVVYRQIKTNLRKGRPLYHLILATHHPVGEKIMSQIFGKELDGQMNLRLYPQTS